MPTTVPTVVLRDLLQRHPMLTALTVAGSVTSMAAQLGIPTVLASIVTAMTVRAPAAGDLVLLGALLLAALAGTLVAGQASAHRDADVTARHRTDLLDRSLALPALRQPFAAGHLVTRLSADAEAPAQIGTACVNAAVTGIAGLAALIALWHIDVGLAVVVVVEMVGSWLVVRIFVRRSSDAENRYRSAQGILAARLVDAHHGIATIRACGTRDQEAGRVLAPLTQLRSAGRASWRSQQAATWQMGLLALTREVILLTVAGVAVVDGQLTVGDLLAALWYSQLALGVLEQVDLLLAIVHSAPGCRRLVEVLDAAETPAPARPRNLPPDARGEVRFEQVTLYGGVEPVLADVTFIVPAGVHLAVVGRSGAGKTLLVGLLGRLIDPQAGRVLLDGVDVRQVALRTLRHEVAYAFEEPALFGTTLTEAIGAMHRTGIVVESAAKAARADGFIRRLPAGYSTSVERMALSGGEIQRVGLARTLACSARVLVLDDAMSNLDTATAAEVGQAIRSTWSGRTALIVAHRATTAASADLVAWLEGGRLVAVAPHRELWCDPSYRAVFGSDGSLAPACASEAS